VDKINYIQGGMKVFTQVYPQLETLNFEQQTLELKLPVYFLLGRHDVNAMSVLAERYYQHLQAPHKELIWLEKSGHLPHYEEPRRFVQIMVDRLLTQPAMV
jgi:pimeloyl-ACP methyl ester carboxylesterase